MHIPEIGYIVQEMPAIAFRVHAAAIMFHTIGHHKVGYLENGIIAGSLVESVLRKSDLRGLAFHDHQGFRHTVVDHNIGPPEHGIHPDVLLEHDQSGRHPAPVDQEHGKMLANPFFRSEHHIFFAYLIKNE